MTLRSDGWKTYFGRMAYVVLFCLAVHALVVSDFCGGGNTLRFWKPERMRLAFFSFLVIGIAAYEFRPVKRDDDALEGVLPCPDGKTASVPEAAPSAPPPAAVSVRAAAVPSEPVRKPHPMPDVPEVSSVAKDRGTVAWDMAQKLPHNFVPDPDADYNYLRLVHDAARAGNEKAMVKLGEYARRRCADVEEYYWLTMARLHGAKGLEPMLDYCRNQWKINGFNPEYENEYLFFTERQGVLGRAALRLDSNVDTVMARERLKSMIAHGDGEARLIYENTPLSRGAK